MPKAIKDIIDEKNGDGFFLFNEREIPDELIPDFRERRRLHNRQFLRVASYIGILVGIILSLRLLVFPNIAGGVPLHQAYLLDFIVLIVASGAFLIVSYATGHHTSISLAVRGQRLYILAVVLVYCTLGWIDMQVAPDYSAIIGLIVYISVTLWISLYGFLSILLFVNALIAVGYFIGLHESIAGSELFIEMIVFSILGIGLFFAINQGRMRNFLNENLLNRTISELKELSLRDPLTRLFNRRMMNDELEKELALSKRTSLPLSIIMIDLDKFKRVNDSLGHDVGDETLKQTARLLNEGVRGSDRVYRFGGEEFLVMAPNTPLKNATALADRLCRLFRRTPFDKVPWPVTASMGLADNTERILSTDLIKLADCRMYEAKDAGRDRYVATGCNDKDESEEPIIPD